MAFYLLKKLIFHTSVIFVIKNSSIMNKVVVNY